MGNRLFDFSSGTMAAAFGVQVHGPHSGKPWHRLAIRPAWKLGNSISRLVWRLRWRFSPRHRWHVIDTGLKPGPREIGEVMLHGMFALLRRYVEDVCGGVEQAEEEAAALYRWWTCGRPELVTRLRTLQRELYRSPIRMEMQDGAFVIGQVDPPANASELRREIRSIENRLVDEDQDALHRLVEIRYSLW